MQAGRGGEQVVVGGIVQRPAAGPAEDHGADVSQPGGAPFEFGCRGLRIAGRQRRERAEAVRMRAHRVSGLVVRVSGQHDGLAGGEGLGGRCDDRQDGDVDPGGVHRLDAALPDVLEPGLVVAHGVEDDAVVPRPVRQAIERLADGDAVPVFFDCDDFHGHALRAASGVQTSGVQRHSGRGRGVVGRMPADFTTGRSDRSGPGTQGPAFPASTGVRPRFSGRFRRW